MKALDQWLQRIEQLHPRDIDLGLERVRRVSGTMGLERVAPTTVIVGGTNGKGSCVSFLEAIAQQAGCRTGVYTSPHLLRYNERICIDGEPVSDSCLIEQFEAVEAARGDVPLTYFEFGTLAAMSAFARASPAVVILEVGMGGRLDAVNAFAADACIVTSIGLDHQRWLGPDRAAIAREKAGIFRRDCPAVIGDPDPPPELIQHAVATGSRLVRRGFEFQVVPGGGYLSYRSATSHWQRLPVPTFGGTEQLGNLGAAIAAMEQLGDRIRLDYKVLSGAIGRARPPARCQHFVLRGRDWIIDVAHNAEAGRALYHYLESRPVNGSTLVVAGFMQDKPVEAFAAALGEQADSWWCVAADYPRAASSAEVANRVRQVVTQPVVDCGRVAQALSQVDAATDPGDRVVVCGSFLVAAAALDYLSQSQATGTG